MSTYSTYILNAFIMRYCTPRVSIHQTQKKRVLRILQNPTFFRFSTKSVLFSATSLSKFTRHSTHKYRCEGLKPDNILVRLSKQACYKRSKQYIFENNLLCLCPIQSNLEAPEGFPVKTKNLGNTKLNVLMGCPIFYERSTAPSSGHFRQQPMPPQAC